MSDFPAQPADQGLWRRGAAACLAALLFAAAFWVAPAAANDLEAKVKAAYLYHLTKFVEWPSLPPNEFRICVIGSESVGSLVGELANRPALERRIKIEVDTLSDPAQCQILFIGRDERRLPEFIKRLRSFAVLTVGDGDDFTRKGGVVGFYLDGGKVKLEVNPDAARVANLRVSAKLLEMARIAP
jgi:hypothetical protein